MSYNIFSFVDLTRLSESDTEENILDLCLNATKLQTKAVCVYPSFVKFAAGKLAGTSIQLATVANFPEGSQSFDSVSLDILNSINNGATEVDVVFPYQTFLSGNKIEPFQFIQACKKITGNTLLKVILETAVLNEPRLIAEASQLAIDAGADFLKTSTGKSSAGGATLSAAETMLNVIKKNGGQVGLKVSGGIRTENQAMDYIKLAERIMGASWLTPDNFRIGASRLA